MKKYTHLVMEIVGGCNARCKYCTTGIKNCQSAPQYRFADVEQFTKALDYVLDHDFFDREKGQLELFSWGEPFLHKQLNEICRRVSERKIRYRLSTNGSSLQLLDKENMEYLDDLCISISGFKPESYGRIHKLDLGQVLKNVMTMAEWFRQCGYPNKMVMNFHVYQFNIGEIPTAERFCARHGITFIPHVAYLADFGYFNDYMLGKLDGKVLYEASKELMLGALDELMKGYDPAYVCKQRNALILDEEQKVLPCAFLGSDENVGSIFDYPNAEALEVRRGGIKACEVCHQSKTYYLVNQDKYFLYGYRRPERAVPLPHIYYDDGSGYAEERTVYDDSGIVGGGAFSCGFDIPEGTKKLRFDPAEGKGCLLQDLRVLDENGSPVRYEAVNGERLTGGELLFRTEDPQIELHFEAPPRRVQIEAKIEFFA